MRIVVNDYSGHPFQVQLSRELARQGHEVLHIYSESFQTPKGGVHRRACDPDSLWIEGLRLTEPFSKYNRFIHRRAQEIEYGRMADERLVAFMPDVVLSANTPLDAQRIVQAATRSVDARFVFWLQDIYSSGIGACLRKRRFPLAAPVGAWYVHLERTMLRRSDAVIAISHDFLPILNRWRIPPERLHVIENWAPADELAPVSQDNAWSRSHALAGKFVYLYSGTIGMKHDPRLLLNLAGSMTSRPDVEVVVISEGANAEWLAAEADARRLTNLRLLPLQPWELMPEVLSTAGALTAILDEEAGAFSVPSKVLSYLCAGRPLLLSVPAANRAARIVWENVCGLVTPPGDSDAFLGAAMDLYTDQDLRERCSANAWAYARRTFDIEAIGGQFNRVLGSVPVGQRLPAMARA